MAQGFTQLSKIFLCEPDYGLYGDYGVYGNGKRILEAHRQFLWDLNELRIDPPPVEHVESPASIVIRCREINYPDILHLIRNGIDPKAKLQMTAIVIVARWRNTNRADRQRTYREDFIDEIAQKIAIALSIYFPGSTQSNLGYVAKARDLSSSMGCSSGLHTSALFLDKHSFPLTPEGSFSEFVRWTFQLGGFWDGRPTHNVERALCFLSHIHHPTGRFEIASDFVWLMAALEALYTSDSTNVLGQIRANMSEFIPRIKDAVTDSDVRILYNFRSRFLHGDHKVSNKFTSVIEDDDPIFLMDEHFGRAAAVVIKTIHEAFYKKLSNLSFTK